MCITKNIVTPEGSTSNLKIVKLVYFLLPLRRNLGGIGITPSTDIDTLSRTFGPTPPSSLAA